uniref:Uncharacterized protein n=1 Tax=Anopheles albimanus TaxID=7167 RepID=A0A182FY72_ANOAL
MPCVVVVVVGLSTPLPAPPPTIGRTAPHTPPGSYGASGVTHAAHGTGPVS